jgi:hypothetical protein
MNEFVIQVVSIILFARCPDVSIIIKVPLLDAIDGAEETIAANVEFSLLNQ